MEKDTEVTPMIFRKWPDGQVIALMPTIAGNHRLQTCESYMHIGQHGSADYDGVMTMTRPATEEEYKDLLSELESIGYNVRPVLRASAKMRRERYDQLHAVYKEE